MKRKLDKRGLRIISASRASRPGNKPFQVPLHFPSLPLWPPFLFPTALLRATFQFSAQCGHLVVEPVMAAEQGKLNKGCSVFFLTPWPSGRKTKLCYAARIYFSFCSPSTLPLIFSPPQASGICFSWVFRGKGRLCAHQTAGCFCKCKCAQSQIGGCFSLGLDLQSKQHTLKQCRLHRCSILQRTASVSPAWCR